MILLRATNTGSTVTILGQVVYLPQVLSIAEAQYLEAQLHDAIKHASRYRAESHKAKEQLAIDQAEHAARTEQKEAK